MANEQIPLLEFSRDSEARAANAAGRFEIFEPGQVRTEYDFRTGESLGILIEAGFTNSVGPTSISGHSSNMGRDSGVAQAPDGTMTAAKFYETSDDSAKEHVATKQGDGNWNSVFFKPAGRNFINLTLGNDGDIDPNAIIDLQNGTVTNSNAIAIQRYADGWVRAINTTPGGTSKYNISFRLLDDDQNEQYAGDGVSGVYVWDRQSESTLTSPVPNGSPRAADMADIVTGDWYKPGGSTFRGTHRVSYDPHEPTILATNGIRIYQDASGAPILDGPGTLISDCEYLPVKNPDTSEGTDYWTSTTGTLKNRRGYFFSTDSETVAHQDIEVPAEYFDSIDAGNAKGYVGWIAGGWSDDDSQGMGLTYLDSNDETLASGESQQTTYDTNPNIPREYLSDIPPNTRTIRVVMHMIRENGNDNNGYITDIEARIANHTNDIVNWRWLLDAPNVDKYTLGRDYDDSKWLNGYIYSLSYEANRISEAEAKRELGIE